MNLTCEVILPFLSFRIRSLNLIRAVAFGKSTGPAKEVGLARWATGPERQPFHACCPCFGGRSMGRNLGVVSPPAPWTTGRADCSCCPACWLCKGASPPGAEELTGCCTPSLGRGRGLGRSRGLGRGWGRGLDRGLDRGRGRGRRGPDSRSCPVGYGRKGMFLCQSQYQAWKQPWHQ